MTSNQIQQAMNEKVAYETNRHNVAMEKLQEESLEIERFKAKADAEYKETMASLTAQYNDAKMQWERESGGIKLALEQRMTDLKEQMAYEGSFYEKRMANARDKELSIMGQKADIEKQIAEAGSWYEQRLSELKKYETEWNVNLGLQNAQTNLLGIQSRFLESQMDYNVKVNNFLLEYHKYDTTGWFSDLASGLKNLSSAGMNFFGMFNQIKMPEFKPLGK